MDALPVAAPVREYERQALIGVTESHVDDARLTLAYSYNFRDWEALTGLLGERGARRSADTIWNATPRGWAEHVGHEDIAESLP